MGKAYRVPGALDRLRKQQREIKDLQAINRLRNTPRPVASTAFAGVSAAGSEGGTGNFLRIAGDTMIGPFALAPPVDFSVEIDADGIIDIGESSSNSQYTSNIQLEDIQPNTFTLDTIAGAAFDGQILVLRTFAPNSPFTISQATALNGGNIQTPNDTDFTIGDLQTISLIFDASLIVFNNAPGGTWRVLTGDATGGGGGLTEPVIFGINTLTPQTLPTTTTIAWNTKNPHQITLDRAVEFDFTNLPANGSYEGILVIIDIDAIGGFDSPIWPASLVNPPVIPTTALSRFSVMLYTIDNGTVVTHATSVGSSTGGEFFGPWTATHDAGIKSLINLALAQYVDIGGVVRGSISGDATLGLVLSTASGGKFSIQDVITPIATWDDTTGLTIEGTHVINMGNNIINSISELQFSNINAHTPSNELSIAFDSIEDALKYSVPLTTDSHRWFANTDLLAQLTRIGASQGSFGAHAIVAEDLGDQASSVLQTNGQLFIADSALDPTTNGQFRRNGTRVKVFTNGILVDLSDAGEFFGPWTATHDAGGQLLDNLGNLNTDAANLPASGKFKLGNDELISWVKTDNASIVSIGLRSTNLFALTGANLSLVGNDIVDTNLLEGRLSNPLNINVPTNGQILNFQFQGVNEWTLSQSTLGGDSIILNNSFILNSSAVDPTNDGQFTRNVDSVLLQSPTFQLQRAVEGTQSGQLALVKVDPGSSSGDGIYRINFKVLDTSTTTTYAQIKADIEDATDAGLLELNVRADGSSNVNALTILGSAGTTNRTFVSLNAESRIGSDLKFQAPTGSTDLKIFPALNALGIVVQDNVSFTVGDDGTIAIPVADLTTIVTVPLLDAAFGTHKGSIGIDLNNLGDDGLWIRRNATVGSGAEWARFDSVTKLVQP